MGQDPYVAERLEDRPRQEQNLAPGVKMPAARTWWSDRPGDLPAGQPRGGLFGAPGPNIGYALTLAERMRDQLALADGEHTDDALALVGEIAMRRAAGFGRAPVKTDLEIARTILGWSADGAPWPDEGFVAWRTKAIRDAAHEYERRRALVDAVPEAALNAGPADFSAQVPGARAALVATTLD
ncbi:MAG: hypothetical protein ACRDWD_10580 [Acidimicrobiia bacterium]